MDKSHPLHLHPFVIPDEAVRKLPRHDGRIDLMHYKLTELTEAELLQLSHSVMKQIFAKAKRIPPD